MGYEARAKKSRASRETGQYYWATGREMLQQATFERRFKALHLELPRSSSRGSVIIESHAEENSRGVVGANGV